MIVAPDRWSERAVVSRLPAAKSICCGKWTDRLTDGRTHRQTAQQMAAYSRRAQEIVYTWWTVITLSSCCGNLDDAKYRHALHPPGVMHAAHETPTGNTLYLHIIPQRTINNSDFWRLFCCHGDCKRYYWSVSKCTSWIKVVYENTMKTQQDSNSSFWVW